MKTQIKLRVFQLFIVILISVGIGYLLGNYRINARWKNFKPILSISNQNPPVAQNLDMRLFYDVVDKLNTMYYDKSKVDAKKMETGAITGMVASLGDPYTAYFPPKQNTDFKTQMAGEFSGIGAELSLNDQNQIIVIAPLDGSPAEKAGVKSGDIIARVDGKMTTGWTIAQAVEKIRGHKGTKVTITVIHPKEKEAHDLSIIRDTIQVKSVTSWVKQFDCSKSSCTATTSSCVTCDTVAYIRISQFGDKTNSEWLTAVNKILPQIKSAKNFKGLILDVRNNPGGYLNDAVYIASEFLKSGSIVKQEDGNGLIESLDVNRTGLLLDIPLAVLINKGSASASEIVSGALQDYGRAKLVGEQSFGKGTIQQAVDVDGGGSVHISVGKWLTPKERWVHGKGLTPDVSVAYDASTSSKMLDNIDNQILKAVSTLDK
jgi:carboxyl-terminal processing protease